MEVGDNIRSTFSNWTSAGGRNFLLFPKFKKNGKFWEVYWLFWVWAKTEKKEYFEEILEDTNLPGWYPGEPDPAAGDFDPGVFSIRHRRNFGEFFHGNPGFAVYANGQMVGWTDQPNVSFEMRQEQLDVTNRMSAAPEFIPGMRETIIQVNDFHLLVMPHFMDGRQMTAIIRMPDGRTFSTEVLMTDMQSGIGTLINTDRAQIVNIRFRGAGEMTRLS